MSAWHGYHVGTREWVPNRYRVSPSQLVEEASTLGEGRPRIDALSASTLPRRAGWGGDAFLARVGEVQGLELGEFSGRRKDEASARVRERVILVGVEVYGLRVKDLAERLRMNPGSASRALARAAKREGEDRTFHEQRLALEGRLAGLEVSGGRSRK